MKDVIKHFFELWTANLIDTLVAILTLQNTMIIASFNGIFLQIFFKKRKISEIRLIGEK